MGPVRLQHSPGILGLDGLSGLLSSFLFRACNSVGRSFDFRRLFLQLVGSITVDSCNAALDSLYMHVVKIVFEFILKLYIHVLAVLVNSLRSGSRWFKWISSTFIILIGLYGVVAFGSLSHFARLMDLAGYDLSLA